MHCKQPQDYYRLALKGKFLESGQPASVYKEALCDEPIDMIPLIGVANVVRLREHEPMLEDAPQPPAKKARRAVAAPALADGAAGVGAPELVDAPAVVEDILGVDVCEPPPDFPLEVDGAPLRAEDCRALHGYYRYILTCQHHPRCFKKRNYGPAQIARLGPYEVAAFLACWHQQPMRHSDKTFCPALSEQRAWLHQKGYRM